MSAKIKVWLAVFYLINVVIESAFLVLPKAMKRTGIALGVMAIVGIALLVYFCYARLWDCYVYAQNSGAFFRLYYEPVSSTSRSSHVPRFTDRAVAYSQRTQGSRSRSTKYSGGSVGSVGTVGSTGATGATAPPHPDALISASVCADLHGATDADASLDNTLRVASLRDVSVMNGVVTHDGKARFGPLPTTTSYGSIGSIGAVGGGGGNGVGVGEGLPSIPQPLHPCQLGPYMQQQRTEMESRLELMEDGGGTVLSMNNIAGRKSSDGNDGDGTQQQQQGLLSTSAATSTGDTVWLHYGFEDLVHLVLGKFGVRVVAAMMVVANFFQAALYIRIGGDNVHYTVEHELGFGLVFGFVCGGVLIVAFAFAYFEKIESLEKASVVAVGCALLIGITIVARMGIHSPAADDVDTFRTDEQSFLTFFVYLFCFNWSTVIIPILRDVENAADSGHRVIGTAIAVATVIFAVVSSAGYLHFAEKTKDNILENYNFDWYTNLLRVGIAVLMALSLPLYLMSLRMNLRVAWTGIEHNPDYRMPDPNIPSAMWPDNFSAVMDAYDEVADTAFKRLFGDFLIIGLLMVTALFTPDLHFLIMLTSSVAVSLFVMVFPNICYIQLQKESVRTAPVTGVPPLPDHTFACRTLVAAGVLIFWIGLPCIIADEFL